MMPVKSNSSKHTYYDQYVKEDEEEVDGNENNNNNADKDSEAEQHQHLEIEFGDHHHQQQSNSSKVKVPARFLAASEERLKRVREKSQARKTTQNSNSKTLDDNNNNSQEDSVLMQQRTEDPKKPKRKVNLNNPNNFNSVHNSNNNINSTTTANSTALSSTPPPVKKMVSSMSRHDSNSSIASLSSNPGAPSSASNNKTLQSIREIEARRASRRAKMNDELSQKQGVDPSTLEAEQLASLIRKWKKSNNGNNVGDNNHSKGIVGGVMNRITVCVRKRPMMEVAARAAATANRAKKFDLMDVVSCLYESDSDEGEDISLSLLETRAKKQQPAVAQKHLDNAFIPSNVITLHEPKKRVDGQLCLVNHTFTFDHVFNSKCNNQIIYRQVLAPLLQSTPGVRRPKKLNFFAYGQTGSGKTYTIFGDRGVKGIFQYACLDIIELALKLNSKQHKKDEAVVIQVRFYEIYLGRIHDLLQGRKRLALLEDRKGEPVIPGLCIESVPTTSSSGKFALERLESLVMGGLAARRTASTSANDTSSRSHAILQLNVVAPHEQDSVFQFSLIDLAGSERANRLLKGTSATPLQKQEASEINKSLLALKECIRALHKATTSNNTSTSTSNNVEDSYIPFRASKLTQVLKDSLTDRESQTIMMVTVAPAAQDADHSMNTLRYADRVKEYNDNKKKPTKSSDNDDPKYDENEQEEYDENEREEYEPEYEQEYEQEEDDVHEELDGEEVLNDGLLRSFKSYSLEALPQDEYEEEEENGNEWMPEDTELPPLILEEEEEEEQEEEKVVYQPKSTAKNSNNMKTTTTTVTNNLKHLPPIPRNNPQSSVPQSQNQSQNQSSPTTAATTNSLLNSLFTQSLLDSQALLQLEQAKLNQILSAGNTKREKNPHSSRLDATASAAVIDLPFVMELESALLKKIESFKLLRDQLVNEQVEDEGQHQNVILE